MQINARIKKADRKGWSDIKINLPNSVKDQVEKYDIDLVEFIGDPYVCVYFREKGNPGEDVMSYTIERYKHHGRMAEGFKQAFEELGRVTDERLELD